MENTSICDFNIGDLVKIIDSHWEDIKVNSIGKVVSVGKYYLRIKWLSPVKIGFEDGSYYPKRFKKITKEEAVIELL